MEGLFKNMKLLMENWRSYVAETEKSSIYGKMYLFEDENIREVSFYEHFNQLNENGDDVERFLEKWERSIDHMFENLDEQAATGVIDDAILKASTQAWMALDKLKGKAVGSVINVMKKLKGYEQKNPRAAKAIKITVAGLAAAAAAAGVYQAMKSGGDAGAVQELAQALSAVEPDVAKDVAEVAQNLTPESAVELISNQEQTVSQVTDALTQSGDQGLQQVAQATEEYESTFGDMMSDLQTAQSDDLQTAYDSAESGAEKFTANTVRPGSDDIEDIYRDVVELFAKDGRIEDLDLDKKEFRNIVKQVRKEMGKGFARQLKDLYKDSIKGAWAQHRPSKNI
jgi:hypothetical protein